MACLILGVGVNFSRQYIDYEYFGYLVQREVSGSPVRSCLDLPERFWSRLEVCYPEFWMTDEEFLLDQQKGKGGVDSSEV